MVSGQTLGSSKWGVASGGNLSQRRKGTTQLGDDELLEAVAWVVVDLVALAEVLYADGDVGHILVLLW